MAHETISISVNSIYYGFKKQRASLPFSFLRLHLTNERSIPTDSSLLSPYCAHKLNLVRLRKSKAIRAYGLLITSQKRFTECLTLQHGTVEKYEQLSCGLRFCLKTDLVLIGVFSARTNVFFSRQCIYKSQLLTPRGI